MAATPALVDHARQLAFHRSPAAALGELEQLAAAACGTAVEAELTWLVAVTLGGLGRFADAVGQVEPLLADEPADPRVAALGAATLASLLRQVGRHAEAEVHDEQGLQRAAGLGPAGIEALVDCQVGLVADAVGLPDLALAQERLAAVPAPAPGLAGLLWRPWLRARWVSAEVALLCGRSHEAAAAGAAAVAAARDADAPRHLAKSLLFLGVATAQDGDRAAGGLHLEQAARLAGDIGALPLVWPAHAVLAQLLAGDERAAARHRTAAGRAVSVLAERLPAEWREPWLQGPDVAWLVS